LRTNYASWSMARLARKERGSSLQSDLFAHAQFFLYLSMDLDTQILSPRLALADQLIPHLQSSSRSNRTGKILETIILFS
jgi:hypothetical protein